MPVRPRSKAGARTQLSEARVREIVENEWLGLGDTSGLTITNPFDVRTTEEIEDPLGHVLSLMRRPEYFAFTCKHLLNKTLPPIQLALLRELWSRPFPMLIGSRGMGKCVRDDTLVHTCEGIKRIRELAETAHELERVGLGGLRMLGESGFKEAEYAWNNGRGPTVRITTRHGFELEGTANHPVRVATASGVAWKDLGDVAEGDAVLIDRSESWHESESSIPDDLAYLYGSNSSVCGEEDFPGSVLEGSKSACAAFVRGLFDTDGCVGKHMMSYRTSSERLAGTLQYVLTRFGIVSDRKPKLNKKYDRIYWHVQVSGRNARLFRERIGFGLSRKREALDRLVDRPVNSNVDAIPARLVLDDLLAACEGMPRRKRGRGRRGRHLMPSRLKAYGCTYESLRRVLDDTGESAAVAARRRLRSVLESHYFYDTVDRVEASEAVTYDVHVPEGHSFVSNGLVSHNSFILGLYAVLRATLCQGSKIVVVGAAFRQAKVIFEYCEEIWLNAPVLRDVCGDSSRNGPRRDIDRCTMRIGESVILAIPLGDGSKIRGLRANILIGDEFASIPNEIFENVVSGFASVSLSPIEKLRQAARVRAMRRLGLLGEGGDAPPTLAGLASNQTILSGTAYYAFNHFYAYWRQYKAIIESRGERRKLEEIFNGEVPEKFNWKDYSVMRIPVGLLPEGFMDEKHVAKARATIHLAHFMMEYGAVFPSDSNGFFKRSLVESCVAGNPERSIEFSCGTVSFCAVLRGDPNRRYVLAVDPASESDRFSITVLELWPDHRRVVHGWTTTRKRHKAKLAKGLAKEDDFYGYAARKIRDLMAMFPTEHIAMDSQGGGVAVMEAMGDRARLRQGEKPIYPVIDEEKPKDTDNLPGLHILELVQFASSDWVSEANHGLRKDLEDKVLLFPKFDPAVVGLAIEEDKILGRVKAGPDGDEKLYDTLEDCVLEIEELKDELATIVHSQTGPTKRDRWDTPEVKVAGGKKGRLRKDRYSSLLMANMAARRMARAPERPEYAYLGGFAHEIASLPRGSVVRPHWQNPDWYTAPGGGFGAVVNRNAPADGV